MNRVKQLTSLLTLWEQKKVELEYLKNKYKNFSGLIFVVSDIHIPFFDEVAVELFFEQLKQKKPKLLVIAGDLVNFDVFSKYQYTNAADAKAEVDRAKLFCEMLLKYCNDIIYIASNHEQRFEKFLIRNLGVDEAKNIFELGFVFEKLLAYRNLKVLSNWFLQICDCIIAHPEVQSIVRARAVDWAIEYFEGRVKDFNCVLIGHTHKQSKIFRKKKLGIEIGALAKTQDYVLSSRFNGYRVDTQYLGYAEVFIEKGKVDINKTNFITLKFEDYIL